MKSFSILVILFFPILCLAQSDSSAIYKSPSASRAALRRQRAIEKNEKLNQLIKQEEEGALIFHKQNNIGIKLNTDGLGFFYEHGIYKTIKKTKIWWIELNEKKARNQKRFQPLDPSTITNGNTTVVTVGSSFIYGKENNFYQLKYGMGQQLLIGGKGNKNGVAVSAIYGGGVGLGLLKPYYIQVIDSLQQNVLDIKYADDNNGFLNAEILGSSGFSKGLNEIKIIPSLHIKGALRFDYGRYREVLSALEVGLNVEYYTKKVNIMAQSEKTNLFVSAFVAIEFGKRK